MKTYFQPRKSTQSPLKGKKTTRKRLDTYTRIRQRLGQNSRKREGPWRLQGKKERKSSDSERDSREKEK